MQTSYLKWCGIARVVSFCILCVGCKEEGRIIDPPTVDANVPVISNRPDSLKFTVDAKHFTFSRDQVVDFSSSKIAVSVSLEDYEEGTAILELRDSVGVLFRLDTLLTDTVIASSAFLRYRPRYAAVRLHEFTGMLSVSMFTDTTLVEMPIWQFPFHLGKWWKYSVTIGSNTDTLVVSSVDDTTLSDGSGGFVWAYPNNTSADSSLVLISYDSVNIVEVADWGFYRDESKIVFPLRLGRQWRRAGYDSARVTAIGMISTPAGVFQTAYQVDEWHDGPNSFRYATRWLFPDVGIVRFTRVNFNGGSIRSEEWNLLDYGTTTSPSHRESRDAQSMNRQRVRSGSGPIDLSH